MNQFQWVDLSMMKHLQVAIYALKVRNQYHRSFLFVIQETEKGTPCLCIGFFKVMKTWKLKCMEAVASF